MTWVAGTLGSTVVVVNTMPTKRKHVRFTLSGLAASLPQLAKFGLLEQLRRGIFSAFHQFLLGCLRQDLVEGGACGVDV